MRKEPPKFFERNYNQHISGFQKGAKFEYNGKYYSAYDTVQRSWRYLNLFRYETYIHARVARIKTKVIQAVIQTLEYI